jgi:putative DNA primase/helicase
MTEVRDLAKGRWKEILPSLGVDSRYLVNKHGPCPICGGEDRFRFDDWLGRGGYICSQCGAGDGFRLASKITGQPFHVLAEKVRNMLGHSGGYEGPVQDNEEIANKQKMQAVWQGAGRPLLGGPVDHYLTTRVGCLWPSQELREASYGQYTVMVARILNYAGQRAVNLHLTFLTPDGRKADIAPAKRMMKGKLPDGCAIRLGPERAVMGVAEGIETAISASIMFDMPVWACVNGMLLSKWIPPAIAEHVTIFGDNDANFTGQSKAYHLANRLEVQFRRKVTVSLPPMTGDDWNDHHHKTWGQNTTGFLRLVK